MLPQLLDTINLQNPNSNGKHSILDLQICSTFFVQMAIIIVPERRALLTLRSPCVDHLGAGAIQSLKAVHKDDESKPYATDISEVSV